MTKNIHGWMEFFSDYQILWYLWYVDTKVMSLANKLFLKIENMWFFTFLGSNWWKMRAAQKLFLILCQVYIYLQKRPRPIRFEEKAKVLPTSRWSCCISVLMQDRYRLEYDINSIVIHNEYMVPIYNLNRFLPLPKSVQEV